MTRFLSLLVLSTSTLVWAADNDHFPPSCQVKSQVLKVLRACNGLDPARPVKDFQFIDALTTDGDGANFCYNSAILFKPPEAPTSIQVLTDNKAGQLTSRTYKLPEGHPELLKNEVPLRLAQLKGQCFYYNSSAHECGHDIHIPGLNVDVDWLSDDIDMVLQVKVGNNARPVKRHSGPTNGVMDLGAPVTDFDKDKINLEVLRMALANLNGYAASHMPKTKESELKESNIQVQAGAYKSCAMEWWRLKQLIPNAKWDTTKVDQFDSVIRFSPDGGSDRMPSSNQ